MFLCDITSIGDVSSSMTWTYFQCTYQNRALSTIFSFVMSFFLFWRSKCMDLVSRDLKFSIWCFWRCRSSWMWHHVDGKEVHDILKDNVFIFRVKQSTLLTVWPRNWRQCDSSNHWGLFLISNFRHDLNVVCFLLGISPASVLDFKKKAIEQVTHKPVCWFRYVDDTFTIWPHGREKTNRISEPPQ